MKKRILIVEDEGITAMDEDQILRDFDYEVVGISMTGEDAILKANENKPDLVLMDIMLAGKMTGDIAANEIRKQHTIPILFVSALGEKKNSNRYEVPEGCGYIVKPYTKEELHNEIEKLL